MFVKNIHHEGFRTVWATWARQNFHELILWSQAGPVGIQRYSQIVAVVWGTPFRPQADRERALADLEFQTPHLMRLLFHYQLALRLITSDAGEVARLVEGANIWMSHLFRRGSYEGEKGEVWRTVLAMPPDRMARQIVRRDRWGFDLRWRSPFYSEDAQDLFRSRIDAALGDWMAFTREHNQRRYAEFQAITKAERERKRQEWAEIARRWNCPPPPE